ncbi:MAG: CDP-alcohol phosphatidyltransferase family protein [Alphaproteobacteria bacterium]|nr:CDP-alcohol phosphatidyltransferase family protein [Alphaproteobacteria bacterium]
MTLANGVTAVRLVLVPFIVIALSKGEYSDAFWMTLIAGATDAVDGYIARAFGHKSLVGAYLDPVADKVLILSLLGMLTYSGHLPLWFVILALGRDVAIVVTVAVFTRMKKADLRMQPLLVSKMTTVAQIALVLATLADLAFSLEWTALRMGLLWGAAAMTIASWGAYFVEGLRAVRTTDASSGA